MTWCRSGRLPGALAMARIVLLGGVAGETTGARWDVGSVLCVRLHIGKSRKLCDNPIFSDR